MTTPPHVEPRIGRYEVLGLIGVGAFADVYRAWDEQLASHVAIKVLHADATDDELAHGRFVEEGQLLRRVVSDHVVRVHDVGVTDEGRPYLVVELAEGGPLGARLEQFGNVPSDHQSAQTIVEGLASGLDALHEAGIVHRDVKPDNLLIHASRSVDTVIRTGLLGIDEHVALGDLGLAKDLETRGSAPSVMGGTAGYQAPEQLRADGEISPATDTYAASAVLWRLVTGVDCPPPTAISDGLRDVPGDWHGFFERALHPVAAERFGSARSWESAALDHLDRAPLSGDRGDRTVVRRSSNVGAPSAQACPYQGLSAFQQEDADRFFGRDDLVAELLQRLQRHRVLVVAGPSGSGKSSLVRAGLLPALAAGSLPGSDVWPVDVMTPGASPFEELHYRLGRWASSMPKVSAAELAASPALARSLLDDATTQSGRVLFVDQFEELFTQHGDGVAADFVAALAAMSDPTDSPLRLVLAVRADFYGRCAQIGWLAERITANQVLVGPMGLDGMRRAVEEPARLAGLRLQHGLVDAVLEEGGQQAGSLPLIAHALTETWAHRDGNTMTIEAYRSVGGVAGAIAQTADALYEEGLDGTQRGIARRLFLRLVTPGEGTSDTRRLLPLTELDAAADPAATHTVVDAFVSARLLSVDESAVQIAHEALIAGWPRLRGWIDTERENLRTQQRIGRAAREWDHSGRDPGLLYRGAPLIAAEHWAADNGASLDRLERDFVDEAVRVRLDDEQRSAEQASRINRNRRRATLALAALAAASVVASIVAFTAFTRASDNADLAERQFATALGTTALGQADSDPAQALLLAVESMERSTERTVDARAALLQARVAMTGPGLVPLGATISTSGSFRVALRPDGIVAAVADQTGPIRLYNTENGQQVGRTLDRHTAGPRALVFSPDGTVLYSSGSDGQVLRWDLSNADDIPEARVLADGVGIVWAIDIHPTDGLLVVAGDDGRLRELDARTGEALRVIEWSDGAGIVSVKFSPNGNVLVASNREGRLQSWATMGGSPRWPDDLSPPGPNLWDIAFSPDGTRFATAGDRDAAYVHDTDTGVVLEGATFGEPAGAPGAVTQIRGVAFSSDGRRLIGGSSTGAVHSWAIDNRADRTDSTARHGDAVEHGALSADRSVYVTVGDDKRLRVWRVPNVPIAAGVDGIVGGAFGVAADPTGARLVVGDGEGNINVVSTGDLPVVQVMSDPSVGHDGTAFDVDWSPDGSTIASIGDGGRVLLWDADAALIVELGSHGAAGREVVFSPDGAVLVSAAGESETVVKVWDVASRAQRVTLDGHVQGVRAADFSDDGEWLATADGRGTIRLWDAQTFTLERSWTATQQVDIVWAVAFGPTGLLASVDSSEDLRVWDPTNGDQVGRTVSGLGTNGATGLDFDEVGDTIAVITRGGELRVVDWRTGVSLMAGPVVAHADAESFGLVFLPNGIEFATTGNDGSVRVWDILSIDTACVTAARRLDMTREADILGGTQPVGCAR